MASDAQRVSDNRREGSGVAMGTREREPDDVMLTMRWFWSST
jgi:hypothetical protein